MVAQALARLGAVHALVLHADVGMDEVSPSGATHVWEVRSGEVRRWTIAPGELALECDDLDGLAGGEPEENATRVERLLEGEGRVVERCAVLLNAAAALYVSGNEWTLAESAARAREAMDQGKERSPRAAPVRGAADGGAAGHLSGCAWGRGGLSTSG